MPIWEILRKDLSPSVRVSIVQDGTLVPYEYPGCYGIYRGHELLVFAIEDGKGAGPRVRIVRSFVAMVEHFGNHGDKFKAPARAPRQEPSTAPRALLPALPPPVNVQSDPLPAIPATDPQNLSPVPDPLPKRIRGASTAADLAQILSEDDFNQDRGRPKDPDDYPEFPRKDPNPTGIYPPDFYHQPNIKKNPDDSDFFGSGGGTPPGQEESFPEESNSDPNEESTSGLRALGQIVKGPDDEEEESDDPDTSTEKKEGWSPSGSRFPRIRSKHGAARQLGRMGRFAFGLAVLTSAMLGYSYGPHPS